MPCCVWYLSWCYRIYIIEVILRCVRSSNRATAICYCCIDFRFKKCSEYLYRYKLENVVNYMCCDDTTVTRRLIEMKEIHIKYIQTHSTIYIWIIFVLVDVFFFFLILFSSSFDCYFSSYLFYFKWILSVSQTLSVFSFFPSRHRHSSSLV